MFFYFSFLDHIYYYTGLFKSPERERKKIIIIEGEKILQSTLDVKYIIKKFYEVEKLKQLLLSDVELKKFARLPRPELKISFEGKKMNRQSSRAVITTLIGKRSETISPIHQLNKQNT